MTELHITIGRRSCIPPLGSIPRSAGLARVARPVIKRTPPILAKGPRWVITVEPNPYLEAELKAAGLEAKNE